METQQRLRILVALLCVLAGFLVTPSLRDSPGKAQRLEPGIPVSVAASDAVATRLGLFAGPADYFEIAITGPPRELRMIVPGGETRSWNCRAGESVIPSLGMAPWLHYLEFRPCDGPASLPLTVRLVVRRPATDMDRLRAQAEVNGEAARTARSNGDRHRALDLYRRAFTGWTVVGDLHRASSTLTDIGQTSAQIEEQIGDALRTFDEAFDIAPEAALQAGAILGKAALLTKIGRVEEGLPLAKQGLEYALSSHKASVISEAHLVLGDAYYWMNDRKGYELAAQHTREAVAVQRAEGSYTGQARALLALATIESTTNDLPQAFDHGKEALELAEASGDPTVTADSSWLFGFLLARTGLRREALEYLERARVIQTALQLPSAQAVTSNTLAQVYADIGDYDSAISFSRRALELFTQTGDSNGEVETLRTMGSFSLRMGDLANAGAYLDRAGDGVGIEGSARARAFRLRDRGVLVGAQGDAAAALQSLQGALAASREERDKRLENEILFEIARVHDRSGDSARALEIYKQVLAAQRALEDRIGEMMTLSEVARSYLHQGEYALAAANAEEAIEASERLSGSLTGSMRMLHFASVREMYDLRIDALMRMAARPDSPEVALALEASERAHARTLLDSLSETKISLGEGITPDLAMRKKTLKAQIESHLQLLNSVAQLTSAQQNRLTDEIQVAQADLDFVEDQLRKKNPRYDALMRPAPVNVQQIRQEVAADGTALLHYAVGSERSYVWVLSASGVSGYPLPKASEIESKVREMWRILARQATDPGGPGYMLRVAEAERRYPALAIELRDTLLGPVKTELSKWKRVAVVADGALHLLPFGALASLQATENNFSPLIADMEVVNLPSGSLLLELRSRAAATAKRTGALAFFADPVFSPDDSRVNRAAARSSERSEVSRLGLVVRGGDVGHNLPRLRSTREEAREIAAMVQFPASVMQALDFGASRVAVLDGGVLNFDILHFATHTEINDRYPEFSSLVLSLVDDKGRPLDGRLRLRDVYGMRLNASLVVLSACDTALGKEIKGEGLQSMVRGFMYAGAPRVVASSWKVDDAATKDLMVAFYRRLLIQRMTPSAALREAQLELMRKNPTRAPYYWAGFQLQGDWKPL